MTDEDLVHALPLAPALFTRVEPWPGDRVLLQVMPGLDATLWRNHGTAAEALGMTSGTELVCARHE